MRALTRTSRPRLSLCDNHLICAQQFEIIVNMNGKLYMYEV